MINKQNQIIRKKFSKQRNVVSESKTTAKQELHNLKYSINENHQIEKQLYFTDSETTSPAPIKRKRWIIKLLHKQANTFVQLKLTNKTHWNLHINSHTSQKWFEVKITQKTQYFHS